MAAGYLGGAFLGWSLGANDAANCFGTAVAARMVSWRRAAVLTSVGLMIGAVLQGRAGLLTLQGLTAQAPRTAGLTAAAAAVTVAGMTALRLPVSTSQAVVGTLVATGILAGDLRLDGLRKVAVCWVTTPFGAMFAAYALFHAFRGVLRSTRPTPFTYDTLLRWGLLVCGAYGAYALGANNVANVAAFLAAGGMAPLPAVAVGSLCMAAGVLTFSRGVMATVGRGITPLDAFSAFVVVLAQAVTVHVYALIGVPVSTSQAIVGAVLGIGLAKGAQIINFGILGRILLGWLFTPVVAAAVTVPILLLAGGR